MADKAESTTIEVGAARSLATELSLRDYFAGHALAGLLASPDAHGNKSDFADDAYGYADAMLKARQS